MKKPIKIKLTRKRWQELSDLLKSISEAAPIADWEVESCLLAEHYESHLTRYTYFQSKDKDITISFKASEAWALHAFFVSEVSAKNNETIAAFSILIYNQLPQPK